MVTAMYKWFSQHCAYNHIYTVVLTKTLSGSFQNCITQQPALQRQVGLAVGRLVNGTLSTQVAAISCLKKFKVC